VSGVDHIEESWGSSVLRPQAYQDIGAVSWIRRRPYREPWRAGAHTALCSLAVCCLALASTQISYTRAVLTDAEQAKRREARPGDQGQGLLWLVPREEGEWLNLRPGDLAAVVSPDGTHLNLGPVMSVDLEPHPRIGVQMPEQALPNKVRLQVEVSRSLYGWVMHSIRSKSKK